MQVQVESTVMMKTLFEQILYVEMSCWLWYPLLEGPVKRAHGARNGSFTHASRHQSHSRQGAGWRSAIICFVAGAIAHICFPSPKICFVAGAIAHICFVSAIICFVAGAVANICFVAAIICFVAGAITTNSFAWPALWLTADLIC